MDANTIIVIILFLINIGLILHNIATRKRAVKSSRDLQLAAGKLEVVSTIMDYRSIGVIKRAVGKIFARTSINMFNVHIAVNGKTDLRRISLVYSSMAVPAAMVDEADGPVAPENMVVDEHYRAIIKQSETEGPVYIEADFLPSGDIRGLLEADGVKGAMIYFIDRISITNEDDMVVFCWFGSTHTPTITNADRAIIKAEFHSMRDDIVALFGKR